MDCESYPGWSTERVNLDFEWTLGLALQEEKYESCVLLLGANDSGIPTHVCIQNMNEIVQKVKKFVPRVFVMGYPHMEQPEAFARAFPHDFMSAPNFTDDCFESDLTHVSDMGARMWAACIHTFIQERVQMSADVQPILVKPF